MTENVSLIPMTKELCRQYYRDFEADPSIYMDMTCFRAYEYSDERADAYCKRQIEKNRVSICKGRRYFQILPYRKGKLYP